jgi:hypothetical protein
MMSTAERSRSGIGTGTYILIGAGGVLLLCLMVFMYAVGAQRSEIAARNATDAQVGVVQVAHDNMWKVLAKKAGVSQQYKPENYRELLAEVVEGRKGGGLAKFVQEQNPNFDLSLLKDLSQSVEASHAIVVREQNRLLDLDREHNNIIQDPLKGLFLSAAQKRPIAYKLITSSRSRTAQETGEDNDVDLFAH